MRNCILPWWWDRVFPELSEGAEQSQRTEAERHKNEKASGYFPVSHPQTPKPLYPHLPVPQHSVMRLLSMPGSPSRRISRGESPSGRRSPKRRRVALACASCRERKVRCDGVRPVCGACQRRAGTAAQCEYLVIADTAKYQTERAYIQSLRDQIVDLEGAIRQPQGPLTDQALSQPVPDLSTVTRCLPASGGEQTSNTYRSQEALVQTESPAIRTLPGSISAMGAAVVDIDEVSDQDQYYGQTSLVSLVQQCAQASPGPPRSMRTRNLANLDTPPSTLSPTSCNIGTGMSLLLSDEFSLPPRQTADWLLDVYFTNSHLFYPWVHKESFLVSYNLIWSSGDNGETTTELPDIGLGGRNCSVAVFFCALNAILAIACEFSNMPAREKRASSQIFYARMKTLMNIDMFDSGSLAHVQALLLVAMYLQCTPYPKRCWNIVGMAYRMSVGLGLHLSRHSDKLSALEREIRWRMWCGCVQMDIIVSMTMGRPAMSPTTGKVPLPSPVDDEYLSLGAEQPTGTVSTKQFLYENMRMIGILGKIISTIYHSAEPNVEGELTRTPDVDFQVVIDIDHSLEEFESSVHPALRWYSGGELDSSEDPTFKRLRNVLHARFLHLKLLLYRPAFSEFCSMEATGSEGRGQRASGNWTILCRANCAASCIRAACDLVASLSQATVRDATGAWWYGVFYLISSGIVLLLASFSRVEFEGVSEDQRVKAWDQCIRTLRRMVDVHPSARDYAIALNTLKERHHPEALQRKERIQSETTEGIQPRNTDEEYTPTQANSQAPTGIENDYGLQDVVDPFFAHWDTGLEDIMLPAHLLQEMDEGLLLPNLF